jgi:DNA invertase Pin-like site-specific DNA recombinase
MRIGYFYGDEKKRDSLAKWHTSGIYSDRQGTRKQFSEMCDYLHTGDIVLVTGMDDLGYTTKSILENILIIRGTGAELVIAGQRVSGKQCSLFSTILNASRSNIKSLIASGIKNPPGRQRKLSEEKELSLCRWYRKGNISATKIGRVYGISKRQVLRIAKKYQSTVIR